MPADRMRRPRSDRALPLAGVRLSRTMRLLVSLLGGRHGKGVRMRVVRAVSAALLGVAMIVGLTACSLIGDRLMTPDPPVKEQQRAAALYFRDRYRPNVEKILFTQDGDRPGLGASWRANAIATIDGNDYYVIISPSLGPSFVGGTGVPPKAPTPPPHLPLTVVYSDETSEVIE